MMALQAIAQHPAIFMLVFGAPAALAVVAYFFPVASLLAWGLVALLAGAGLGVLALASIQTQAGEGAILAVLMGAQAGLAAAGAIGTGLMLIAIAGAIRSIRARLI